VVAGVPDGQDAASRIATSREWAGRAILGLAAISSVVAAVSGAGLPWSRRSVARLGVIVAHITSCGLAWLGSGAYLIRRGRQQSQSTRLAWGLFLTSATWLVFVLGAAIVVQFLPDD